MPPLEDGNTGVVDDAEGARVSSGRLLIIPADSSGNPVTVNAEASGYSIASRALLYDANGNAIGTVAGTPRRLATQMLEDRPATAIVTSVAASTSTVTLLASNTSRRMAMITNYANRPAFVKLGASASTTSYTVKLDTDDYYELPFPAYTGIITAVWDIGVSGSARVTELT